VEDAEVGQDLLHVGVVEKGLDVKNQKTFLAVIIFDTVVKIT
jgi:hypothetical protein